MDRWAEEHPLTNDKYLRRSSSEVFFNAMAEQEGGGFSQIGSMAEMAKDSQQMAVVFSRHFQKELRWQSELLMASMTDSSKITPMLDALQRTSVATAFVQFMEQTPYMIAKERAEVFLQISRERLDILSDIERQRIETLAQALELVQTEREVMFQEVQRMVAEERAFILASAEDLTTQSFAETRGVIDYLMMWIVSLGAGTAVLLAVGFTLYKRRASGDRA